MTKYQGHRSWNAWNVSLWINNDEGLYSTARMLAQECGIGEGAKRFAEIMRFAKTPDGAPYTHRSIREAMRGILS